MPRTVQGADHRLQGNDAFSRGDFTQAVKLYTLAIESVPLPSDPHILYGNRAAAHLRLGAFEEAVKDSTSATTIQPIWAKGWYRKAVALESFGQLDDAIAASRQGAQFCSSKGLDTQISQLQARLTNKNEHVAAAAAAKEKATNAGQSLEAFSSGGSLTAEAVAKLLPSELRSKHSFQNSHDGVNSNLLLLFHGLGDTPDKFAELARSMQLPQTAALAVGGPLEVPLSNGGRAWFESFDTEGNLIKGSTGSAAARRDASLRNTLKSLQAAIYALSDSSKGGWPRHHIHLFGFSQGGTVALHLGAANTLGSCAAVSAAMNLAIHSTDRAPLSSSSGSNKIKTPILITHGDSDVVVSRDDVMATCSLLNASCAGSARVVSLHKGHSMISGPEEMRKLMAFWASHLKARPSVHDDNETIMELQ